MSAVQAQKKPGGAGVKLFQAIKDVNQGCSTPRALPAGASPATAGRLILTIVFFYDIILKNIIICKDMEV